MKKWIPRLLLAFIALMLAWVGISFLASAKPKEVIRVNGENPRLQAAIKEAQDSLEPVLKDLQAASPGKRFALKVRFTTKEGPEYLWVKSPVISGKEFSGKLDQEPIAMREHHIGETVTFKKEDIVDWIVRENGVNRGAFTEKALAGN